MDINCVKEINGKKYNQFDQEIIPCAICGKGTTALGTRHCDRCHELDTRISMDLNLAEKILNYYKNGGNGLTPNR